MRKVEPKSMSNAEVTVTVAEGSTSIPGRFEKYTNRLHLDTDLAKGIEVESRVIIQGDLYEVVDFKSKSPFYTVAIVRRVREEALA